VNFVMPPALSVRLTGTRRLLLLLFLLCGLAPAALAEIQFDVFLGYGDLGGGGIIPEAAWFPVVCEVKNDGPTFVGVIEVSGSYNQNQTRRIVVELPTGTLKRFSLPVFSATRYQGSWDVRLLDEHGVVHAEHANLNPRAALASGVTILGALPRTSAGAPVIRQIAANNSDLQPAVARFAEGALLPDNPLEWESMDCFYLNSERALDLGAGQVNALLAWLNNGGHLIVGVEAISDINATPWLRSIVPCDLAGMVTVTNHAALQQWLLDSTAASGNFLSSRFQRNNSTESSYARAFAQSPYDAGFEGAELLVAAATPRDGQVLAAAGDTPLIINSRQGRGQVTVLLFNPERDPFRSWKNLPSFWARLAGVPPALYLDASGTPFQRGGYSIDGVFGAMIDSKQVRKLPVEWLLLLLIAYLVVIGPLDQYWLKRLKRPMFTWLTFPCYVVCFSLLIYFIGYKLRAGETEWNELHLVDVIANGDHAELRGRTYASIYSPVNATYAVGSDLHYSVFRGEFHGSWGAGSQDERADIVQAGDNFKADIFVPVWTSQLYTSDWWQSSGNTPLSLAVVPDGVSWSVTVNNHLDSPLGQVRLAMGGRVYDLGPIPAAQTKTFNLTAGQGEALDGFVKRYAADFRNAAMNRQSAFGASGSGRIDDLPDSSMALSLLSFGETGLGSDNFELPPGLDLSPLVNQGQAVLLAWEPDHSPVKPMNQFPTRRSRDDTLWRVAVPVNAASAAQP
jgi:hypothetical protein